MIRMVKSQTIVFTREEIVQSRLSMMHMATLKGLPTNWSEDKKVYEIDWTKVRQAITWQDQESWNIYIRWESKDGQDTD